MTVLVTGGAGYIGSHTVVELLNAGHETIIVDDLSNAKLDVIDRIETITGKLFFFGLYPLRPLRIATTAALKTLRCKSLL